jgi:two-component system nitrate/nitrite response regulator NarL
MRVRTHAAGRQVLLATAPASLWGERATSYSIFVVARIQIYREGLTALFASSNAFAVVGSASCINDSLEARADAVLVDCSLMSPELLANYCRLRSEQSPVIAFGVPENINTVLALLEAGATGYVGDDATAPELYDAVLAVIEHSAVLPTSVADALLDRLRTRSAMTVAQPFHLLTARELEVAGLMGSHRSNKEIAATLGISLHTVKVHVHHIIQKLELERRSEIRDALTGIGLP